MKKIKRVWGGTVVGRGQTVLIQHCCEAEMGTRSCSLRLVMAERVGVSRGGKRRRTIYVEVVQFDIDASTAAQQY